MKTRGGLAVRDEEFFRINPLECPRREAEGYPFLQDFGCWKTIDTMVGPTTWMTPLLSEGSPVSILRQWERGSFKSEKTSTSGRVFSLV